MKKTIKQSFPNNQVLEIQLDSNEIFPEAGMGTPAMVILKQNGREIDSGTFNCASSEGELSHNGTQLTQKQSDWLYNQDKIVEKFIEDNSK